MYQSLHFWKILTWCAGILLLQLVMMGWGKRMSSQEVIACRNPLVASCADVHGATLLPSGWRICVNILREDSVTDFSGKSKVIWFNKTYLADPNRLYAYSLLPAINICLPFCPRETVRQQGTEAFHLKGLCLLPAGALDVLSRDNKPGNVMKSHPSACCFYHSLLHLPDFLLSSRRAAI